MFPDNVVLVAETQEKVQDTFDELSVHCKKWKLELNTQKTKLTAQTKGMYFSSTTVVEELRVLNVLDMYLGFTF